MNEAADSVDSGTKRMAESTASAGESMKGSMTEARGSMMLLGEELGVRIPRHLQGLIAQIPGVGAAFAAMLPIVGVVAAIGVVLKLVEAHEKLEAAIRKASEAAAAQAIKEDDAVKSMQDANLKLQDQISILEGGPAVNKVKEALLENSIEVDKLAEEFATQFQKIDETVATSTSFMGSLKQSWLNIGEALISHPLSIVGANEEAKLLKSQFEQVGTALSGVQDAQLKLDSAGTGSAEQRKVATDAYIASLHTLQQQYIETLSTAQSQTKPDIQLMTQLKEQIHSVNAALQEMQLQSAKAPLMAKVGDLEQAKQLREETEKQAKAAEEAARKWQEHEAALERNKLAMQQLATEEDAFWAKVKLDQLKQEEEAMKATAEATDKLKKATQELSAEQAKIDEANVAATYKSQAEAIKNLTALKVISAEEADARMLALDEKEANDSIAILTQQLNARKAALDAALAQVVQAETQTDQNVLMAAETAYDQQKLAYMKVEEEIVKVTQKTADEKAAIEQQNAKRISDEELAALNTVNSAMNSNLLSWMEGHETFKQAAEKAWNQLASTAVMSLLKIGEQEIEGALLHKSLGATQKLDDAGTAAAGAWSSAASIPIIGFVLAPIAAAAAFAGVMAFDEGGIVPSSSSASGSAALLHPSEMVLPADLSMGIQSMIRTGSNPGTMATNITVNHHSNINAIDATDMQDKLKGHASFISNLVLREARRSGGI